MITTEMCECTVPTWCLSVHDVDELKERADAREGQRLELCRLGDFWYGVHTVNCEPDPYIVCLFGDFWIPLPFTRDATNEMITAYRDQLEKFWPNHEVIHREAGVVGDVREE